MRSDGPRAALCLRRLIPASNRTKWAGCPQEKSPQHKPQTSFLRYVTSRERSGQCVMHDSSGASGVAARAETVPASFSAGNVDPHQGSKYKRRVRQSPQARASRSPDRASNMKPRLSNRSGQRPTADEQPSQHPCPFGEKAGAAGLDWLPAVRLSFAAQRFAANRGDRRSFEPVVSVFVDVVLRANLPSRILRSCACGAR